MSCSSSPGSTPMAVARSQEWTTQSATSWTSSCLPGMSPNGVVHGSLQRAGLCECRADRAHSAFARRDRGIAGRPALLQNQPQLRDGNALKEAAVHVPAHDQVTDQRPDIPLSARRGAIPLTGPDLPDELHIALADGVKGVQDVHGHSFLRPPPGTQGPGPLRPSALPDAPNWTI